MLQELISNKSPSTASFTIRWGLPSSQLSQCQGGHVTSATAHQGKSQVLREAPIQMVIGDTSLMVVMPQQAPTKAVAGYNVTNQTLDVFLRTNPARGTACTHEQAAPCPRTHCCFTTKQFFCPSSHHEGGVPTQGEPSRPNKAAALRMDTKPWVSHPAPFPQSLICQQV